MRDNSFWTDGWRARVGEDFNADNVARIADAAGELWQKTYPGKTVYIGYDTRPRAREFAELAAGVLAAHGLMPCSRPVLYPRLPSRGLPHTMARRAGRSW